jgi:hypothetical protein
MVLPLIAAALMAASSPATEPEQREFHERTEKYEIDFQYPVIAGADQFNAAVSQIVDKRIENFKDQFNAQVTDTRESRKKTPPTTFPGYLTGRYTASVLRNGIVTVLLQWTEYVPPAAHPGHGMASVNYDTRTRRVLALSDLFRPDANYVSRLSELAIASLSRREYAVSEMVFRGAGPVADNFKVFTLTDSSLVLHFPTYQVAPGAAGPQEVEIPLDALAPLLRRS